MTILKSSPVVLYFFFLTLLNYVEFLINTHRKPPIHITIFEKVFNFYIKFRLNVHCYIFFTLIVCPLYLLLLSLQENISLLTNFSS